MDKSNVIEFDFTKKVKIKGEGHVVPYFGDYTLRISNGSTTISNKEDLELFYNLIKDIPNCVILDIGANKGYYAALTTLKEDLFVYAFEPLETVYNRFLLKILEMNNVRNKVCVFNFGLLDEQCTRKLYYDNTENATIEKDVEKAAKIQKAKERRPETWERYNEAEARFDTLDNVMEEHHLNVDVVKIDVEGAELMTLKGGEKFFREQKPLLFVEIEERHCKRFGNTVEKTLDYIRSLGYTEITPAGKINYICK